MNTKKLSLLFGTILILSLLAGCAVKGPNYTLTTYGLDPNFNVVEMKTYDPASEEFTFRYDTREWTLEEWPEEEAPNMVALVNVSSDDKYKCVILPGTIGTGLGEGNQAIEGSLLTEHYVGRTIDVFNPIGIHLIHVVGYEIGEVAYIFETQLPSRDPDSCEIASQVVVSSFNVKTPVNQTEEEEEATTDEGEITDEVIDEEVEEEVDEVIEEEVDEVIDEEVAS